MRAPIGLICGALLAAMVQTHAAGPVGQHPDEDDIESENLFGVTVGSDTEEAGATGVGIETVARFGKRDGRYTGIGKKLEFSYGLTDSISVAFGLLADYHRIIGVTGFTDTRALRFNGIGGELRWRVIERRPGSFGLTLRLEPSRQRVEESTGLRTTLFGSENKLILDTELVKDRVFGAVNLLYELERARAIGSPDWEHESTIGVAVAAAVRVRPKMFAGAELRYLRAYEGLLPNIFQGDAWYLGPTLHWQFAPKAWLTAAWNVQVAGREAGTSARLDLTNFERHQILLKAGIEF